MGEVGLRQPHPTHPGGGWVRQAGKSAKRSVEVRGRAAVGGYPWQCRGGREYGARSGGLRSSRPGSSGSRRAGRPAFPGQMPGARDWPTARHQPWACRVATRGYRYVLQEWGYQAWNIAPASPIDIDHRGGNLSIQKLDESFFHVRFDRLTPREKDCMPCWGGSRVSAKARYL